MVPTIWLHFLVKQLVAESLKTYTINLYILWTSKVSVLNVILTLLARSVKLQKYLSATDVCHAIAWSNAIDGAYLD